MRSLPNFRLIAPAAPACSSSPCSPLANFTVASLTALLGVATDSCFVFLDGFESEGTDAWTGCTGCGS